MNRKIVSAMQDFLNKHNKLIRLFKISLEKITTEEYKIFHKADKTLTNQKNGQ